MQEWDCIVNQSDTIYERDLGPMTEQIASAMKDYTSAFDALSWLQWNIGAAKWAS
jgi:hypothetical protein